MRFKEHAPLHDRPGRRPHARDAEGLDGGVGFLFRGDGVVEVGHVGGGNVGYLYGAQFLGSATMIVNVFADIRAEQRPFLLRRFYSVD